MLKYFKMSILVAVLGLLSAYFWGEYRVAHAGFLALFIVSVLAILETSLSFDNAVINATKLEKMSAEWQHRFLTWGILIAVFGMRLFFPIAVVSFFSGIPLLKTAKITISDTATYTYYLKETHSLVLFFGAAFLLMLFLHYFFDETKRTHWLKPVENIMALFGDIEGIEAAITLVLISVFQYLLPVEDRLHALLSGICGIVLYIIIHGLSQWMESHEPKTDSTCIKQTFKAGLVSFLYLELIDASFSLDGVLGAFALSKDIILITLGLAIGAMFVRSFTIMLVDKKALDQFIYLEQGAHWAIGVLAIIMLYSTLHEVPEVVTGLSGLILIVWSLVSSIAYNKKQLQNKD